MKYKCLESLRGETRGSSDKAQTSFRIGQLWKSPSTYRHTILLVQIVLNAECSFTATEQQQRAGVVVEKKIKANEIGIGQVTVSDGNK